MIPIIEFDNKRWVHSVDFYQHIGLSRQNYTRWVLLRVRHSPLSFKGRDYVEAEDDRKVTKSYNVKYYFRVGFARELCTFIGTSEARRMKEWLMRVEGII